MNSFVFIVYLFDAIKPSNAKTVCPSVKASRTLLIANHPTQGAFIIKEFLLGLIAFM
jgi:hypothetical protein